MESLNGSFHYGVVILVITALVSTTIGWLERGKKAPKDDPSNGSVKAIDTIEGGQNEWRK